MEYLAGKYASVNGPVLALVLNAVCYNNVIRDNGNAVSFSQGYMVATNLNEFNAAFSKESGNSPIYSKAVLDTVLGADISYSTFKTFVETKRT